MNNQTIMQGFGLSLEEKTETAIALLKQYEAEALQHSPDGYWLAFSGGKDSCVIKQLAIMAGVKFRAMYSQTTIDPPELIYFMREHHKDVEWVKAKESFFSQASRRGLPTRLTRWCCEEYKETVGDNQVTILGVRTSESTARLKRWKPITFWRNTEKPMICPIVYWSDDEVWQFIHNHNLPYCKLYDEGWKRLGCIGCPMSGNRKKEFARWNRFEYLWKKTAQKFFEKRRKSSKPVTWKSWTEYWDWWMETTSKPQIDESQECLGLYDE